MNPTLAKWAAWLLLAIAGLAAAGPSSAAPATGVHADVNDFEFESFEGDYYLGTDDEGRSTLRTVEKFVAIFPEFDQNRGILRALVNDYDGHPTDIEIVSVTDENGQALDWHPATEDEGSGDEQFNEIVIRDDDPNIYVHGRQTYVITYDQHNVTRYFADTGVDEFYWDTNGTGWFQLFRSVTARVHVGADLAGRLSGDAACYRGALFSDAGCEIVRSDEGDETVFTASETDLFPGENVTVAIGFEPGTFVPRDDSYLATNLGYLQLLLVVAAIAAAVWAIALRWSVLRDAPGRPTIIAEYAPPAEPGLFTTAVLIKRTQRAAAATFINLAVDRNIRIIETPSSGWFSRKPAYTLELVSSDGLDDQDWQLAVALFGRQLVPGSLYTMAKTDVRLSRRVQSILQGARKKATSGGWRKKIRARFRILPLLAVVVSGALAFVVAVIMAENAFGGALPFLLLLPVALSALIVFNTVLRMPLSEKGAELRDHIKGLELYIRLAEADRLRVLQSPEGAERTPVSASDTGQVLRLYEKLLPYAVLFKLEERWAEELGRYYTDSSPDWYSGSTAFNASVFATSISSLSAVAATSYSGSSSSSSSGGSGGGGSSGGGGGGGGGGGV